MNLKFSFPDSKLTDTFLSRARIRHLYAFIYSSASAKFIYKGKYFPISLTQNKNRATLWL